MRLISWTPVQGASVYRLLSNGEQLAELGAGITSYTDAGPAEPGQLLAYVVRAVNPSGTRDSAAHEFTVPALECEDHSEDPDEPEDPEGPEEPRGPEDPGVELPGPFDYLAIELRCTPFGEVYAEWGAVHGATSYALLQGHEVIHEVAALAGEPGSAQVEPIPGSAFEFTLRARNETGTLDGPTTVPLASTCLQDEVQLAAGHSEVLMVDEDGALWGWGRNADHTLGMGGQPLLAPATTAAGLTNVRKLLLRRTVGMALSWNGTVQAWGTSVDGLLGRAGPTTIETAETVPGLSGIVDVALG